MIGMISGALIIILIYSCASSIMLFKQKIAVIRIKGTISSSSSLFEQTVSPESLYPLFEKIEKDSSVKGVLIEINSPGGSVVASREISAAIKSMETGAWVDLPLMEEVVPPFYEPIAKEG